MELFSSYGLTQKAIDLLEVILQRVPGHAQTLELLLDHHLGAGDERRTAELAEQLEQIHTTSGNTAAADRFADLRRRYAQAAQATEKASPAPVEPPAPAPVLEFSLPAAAPETEPAEFTIETSEIVEAAAEVAGEAASADSAVHELDLSEEWAALATELEANASEVSASETNQAPPEADAAQEFAMPAAETPAIDEVAEIEDLLKAEAAVPASSNGASSNGNEPAADYVLELDTEPAANEVVAKAPPATAQDFFDALSSDLDAALPEIAPERAAKNNSHDGDQAAKSRATKPAPADVPQGPLSEIFDQFRSEVGEPGAEDEDLETHYNLGIAYREMGLIEEAISEFQKVAKGSSEGQAFRYAMQCCTLLGLAFMEKGQPAIAAMWYERALAMPGLDQESILALRYDLGVAQELAGDMAAARKSFSQVYGMNIDYRDVAERLSSLGNER